MQLKIKNEELRIEKGELNHVKNYSLFIINSKLARRAGFTLAEVLITLGIIGVVAAITMPTLIANYQKYETITKLKKVYSIMNQAFKLSEIQNDEHKYWYSYEDIGIKPYVEKYWVPFLNGAKECENYSDCGYKEDNPWQTLANARKDLFTISNGANYILPDGTFIGLFIDKRYATWDYYWLIDLNGGKNPNIYGKDLFAFVETDLGFYPFGYNKSGQDFDPNGRDFIENRCNNDSKDAFACAAKIIVKDNWQIKDDYPW